MDSTELPSVELRTAYQAYVTKLRTAWLTENRSRSKGVFEVMSQTDKDEVRRIMARWEAYITPLAEAWWKERGYGIVWPTDNALGEQYFKLETT